MQKIIAYIFIALLGQATFAQNPIPAANQASPILLKGGIAHLGNGTVINNSIIAFDLGKLTLVTEASTNVDLTKYQVIDVTGKHVYPGFILPNSRVGLEEVSSLRATRDANEMGLMKPHIRSLVAYNTDSKIPPTFIFNGILIAESTPAGGRISGTSSAMYMDGWNWEDAVLKADLGVHINWPSRMSGKFDYATYTYITEPNKDYVKQVNELKTFFKEASAYSQMKSKERNLKLEAMSGVFSGEKKLFIHAGGTKEIIESIKFGLDQQIEGIVLLSGSATLDASAFLAENKIPVILGPVHRLPDNEDMEIQTPFRLASILTEAGITVALSHSGMLARARNLPFYAGTTAAYGLTKEQALQLITLNAASILGISDKVGSLEVGKNATLFVSTGDALDMISNKLTHAFIDGKSIELKNEQELLSEKYRKKYGQE